MDYLPDSDAPTVSRLSSANQYQNFLGVKRNGIYCPLVFDQLDGIVCGKVHSHKIMIYFDDWIGYHFPVKKCRYKKAQYMIARNQNEILELLPEIFGRGDCWHRNFVENKIDKTGVLIGENGRAVGIESEKELNIGLDYMLADDSLEPVD